MIAQVTIYDDNGNSKGAYELTPSQIYNRGISTIYVFEFEYNQLNYDKYKEESEGGVLLIDQYNHIEGKKVPLIHTDKEKRLIEEANQRIRKSQVEQAKGAIRSANFIAK